MSNDRHGVSNYRSMSVYCFERFVQTNNKETPKVFLTAPLWGESTGHRWFPAQMDSNAEKFSIYDVMMDGNFWSLSQE